MAFLVGKYARVRKDAANVASASSWSARFSNDDIDQTTFEAATANNGKCVFYAGGVGILQATFTVEGIIPDAGAAVFFPLGDTVTMDFYHKKDGVGYIGVTCNILSFGPGSRVKEGQTYTCEMKATGAITPSS